MSSDSVPSTGVTPPVTAPSVVDWSTVHKPATDVLYSSVIDTNDWSTFRLISEQVNQFWKDGYIANVPILTPEQCDLILKEYQFYLEGDECTHPGRDLLYEFHSNQSGDPTNVLVHVLGHWRLTSLFHDLVFHPKVVVPCSQLLVEKEEKAVRFWHDQLFAKPAKYGGVVAWHQDYSYWTRTIPQMHVTVHIALDDQTLENGCLHYIPGSHRWNRDGKPLPVLDFNFKDMEGIKTILTPEELRGFRPTPALLKKGEASFHNSMTIHGSYANNSEHPRRATVLNYFADGVLSDSDEPLLCKDGNPRYHSASNIPKGKKMDGQFYPLVFDPKWLHKD